MVRIFCLIMATFFSATVMFSQQKADDLLGIWENKEKKEMILEFFKADNGNYYGNSIKRDKKSQTRSASIRELNFEPKTATYTGKMSPPDKDVTLNVTISFEGRDKIKILAKKFLMTKVIYLERVENPIISE